MPPSQERSAFAASERVVRENAFVVMESAEGSSAEDRPVRALFPKLPSVSQDASVCATELGRSFYLLDTAEGTSNIRNA
jgi:hypothetical protein